MRNRAFPIIDTKDRNMKRKILWVGIFLCVSLLRVDSVKAQEEKDWRVELVEIDNQVYQLERMKRGYEGQALRQENQAQRLQFINEELQTAKVYWKLAEESRQTAQKIQEEIDRLEARKNEILQSHNLNRSPYAQNELNQAREKGEELAQIQKEMERLEAKKQNILNGSMHEVCE